MEGTLANMYYGAHNIISPAQKATRLEAKL